MIINKLEEDLENNKYIEKNSLINNNLNYKYFHKKSINNYIILHYIILKRNYIKSFIILIFIIYIINLIIREYIYYLNDISETGNEIYINYENKKYLKRKMINQFNSYIIKCLNGKLDYKTFRLSKHPKISVIMPIYNGGKYLFYSLRSIQNQKFKDIEIILIDDFSNDDSINIIQKYMKEDPRIRLIKNNKNRKILYSKSIAALNSKGKYIIQLDQDDMFIRNDCFNMLYYEAELNDLDLVHIRDFSKKKFLFDSQTKVNNIEDHLVYPQNTNYKNQPLLKNKMFCENNIYLLWGLLIKTDLYKKAIYRLWPIIMNYQIIFHEDYTISFMLIILAKKYKYLNRFAILHLIHSNSISNNYINNNEYYLSILFFVNVLYKYYLKDNQKDINILINFIILFFNSFQYGKKLYPNLYYYIINIILNNEFLSDKDKEYFLIKLNITKNDYNKLFKNVKYMIDSNNTTLINSNLSIEEKKNESLYIFSIILYCDEFKYLSKTINTLLNQKYIKFEIIIIYDSIEQEDLFYIENYIKNFPFIKLINNKEKKGIIFSISVAVQNSNGNYILILQSSYTLTNDIVLSELYHKIIHNNIDILEFNLLVNHNNNISHNNLNLYKCSHIKSNINIDLIKYNKLIEGIDQDKELLFNKLIKSDLLKNIINEYKLINYKEVIYNYYDNIFIFCLSNSSYKFEHSDIYGVIKNDKDINELRITKIMNEKNQKIKDSIFYINFLYENTLDTFEGKKIALNELYNILSIIYNKSNQFSKDSLNLIERFKNSKFINISDKNNLIFLCNSLIN